MRFGFKVLVFALLLAVVSSAAVPSRGFKTISWTPHKLTTGSPCLFRVEIGVVPAALDGKWQGHDLVFVPSTNGHTWYALAGIDVEAKPGYSKLEVQATLENGTVIRQQQNVMIARAKYPTETLRVPDRYVEPDQETLVRIEADRQLKHEIFSHETESAEWSGPFHAPLDTAVTEGFGTRRTFNGRLQSIHRGIDYHAPPGTPILAANSGQVVLARELFYEGNCVVIDHGFGFMTIYMHLSRFEVSEGQKVETRQEIGLSGATGRVTGPHLHMAVRWDGAYLDPAELWALPLPDLHESAVSRASAHEASR